MPFVTGSVGGGSGANGTEYKVTILPARKCTSIAYDAKFCVLVEAAGDDGLRFRQFNPEAARSNAAQGMDRVQPVQSVLGEVFRYLNVPASHVAFTPYNMMLCCHRSRLSMVRHCTGRLMYETTLDCTEISGVAFDIASDSFFVSDSVSGSVLCMRYMEFHKSHRLDLKYSVVPSGMCIFANAILISNKNSTDSYCGLCYKLDDGSVHKINRIPLSKKVTTGKQQRLGDAASVTKESRPSSLNGVAILHQAGGQQSTSTMVGISEADRALYMFRVRLRKVKEGSNQLSLVFKFKARDESNFIDSEGNARLPRSVAAISSEYMAVYYEMFSAQEKVDSSGILLFRLKPSVM